MSVAAREQPGSRQRAVRCLRGLGWRHLDSAECLELRGGTRGVLMTPRLVEFLQTRSFDYKGAPHRLSAGGIDQILRELGALGFGDGLLAASERLYARLTHGITVTEFMPDGKRHQPTIALIDWSDAAANRFEVTETVRVLSVQGTHLRAPDIVGYVNGIPLAVIEARPCTLPGRGSRAMVLEGIRDHLRHQQEDEIPHLFAYAQLLLSISRDEARYGTTRTPANFWAKWNKEEEIEALRGRAPDGVRPPAAASEPDRLLASLLTPARLLELVRGFVLFDRKAGKLVARHQQFFGVRALLKRLGALQPGGSREGGVVWHTTGSGKSLTMVFLTKALLLHESLQECRVVVVTDRLDLEDQLARNFMNGGAFGASAATLKELERSKALTGRDLARRIGQGAERITFALVQKFNTASRLPECRNDSSDIIVLVDESHRSHGGLAHERMKKALPRAAYVAFTGTPLLRDEKAANRFGPIVHAYTMRRAVEDHAVLPLLYEERSLGAGDDRIEVIARDIAMHFSENFKRGAPELKAQLATASKRDAVRYKKALDRTGQVSSVLVMSPPGTREGAEAEADETSDEVLEWWRQNVAAANGDALRYERQALRAFRAAGGPDLLIVVDRLLTGFDEPRNAVLYNDKPLRSHGLVQAVARVNRLHDGKRHGLLIDYRGILEELDTALRAYQDLEARTQGGFDIADLDGLYRQVRTDYARLPVLHETLWSFFEKGSGRDDPGLLRRQLSPRFASDGQGGEYDARQKLRDDFAAALTAFGLCLQTALSSRSFLLEAGVSEPLIARYRQDLRLFVDLRRMLRRDALESAEADADEARVGRFADAQPEHHQVREAESLYALPQPAPSGDAMDAWPDEKTSAEADAIQSRLRKTLAQGLADDPYARRVFSHALKSAGAAAFEPRARYALLRDLEAQVHARATPDMPAPLMSNPKARAYFGAILLVLGDAAVAAPDASEYAAHVAHALAIDHEIRQALAEHSLNPQSIEAAIRRKILTRLHAVLGLEKTHELIRHVLQIAQAGVEPAA